MANGALKRPITAADLLVIALNVSAHEGFLVTLDLVSPPSGNLSCLLSVGLGEEPAVDAISACLEEGQGGAGNSSCRARVRVAAEQREQRLHSALDVYVFQSALDRRSLTISGEASAPIAQ